MDCVHQIRIRPNKQTGHRSEANDFCDQKEEMLPTEDWEMSGKISPITHGTYPLTFAAELNKMQEASAVVRPVWRTP